jgi:murein DD-endopeptidase MepM/ murein hydrolase activator NlpD
MTSGASNSVYAMGDGVVFEQVAERENRERVFLLKILHKVNGQDVEVQYTHIRPAAGLTLNSTVQAGQEIGKYGAFGDGVSWPHLHLSFKRGKYGPLVDPALYWPAGQVPTSFSHGNPILPGP